MSPDTTLSRIGRRHISVVVDHYRFAPERNALSFLGKEVKMTNISHTRIARTNVCRSTIRPNHLGSKRQWRMCLC